MLKSEDARDMLQAAKNLRDAISEAGGEVDLDQIIEMELVDLLVLCARNHIEFRYINPNPQRTAYDADINKIMRG